MVLVRPQVNCPQPSYHPNLATTTSSLPAESLPGEPAEGRKCGLDLLDILFISGMQCHMQPYGKIEAGKGRASPISSSDTRLGTNACNHSNLKMSNTFLKNGENYFIFLNTFPGQDNVKEVDLKQGTPLPGMSLSFQGTFILRHHQWQELSASSSLCFRFPVLVSKGCSQTPSLPVSDSGGVPPSELLPEKVIVSTAASGGGDKDGSLKDAVSIFPLPVCQSLSLPLPELPSVFWKIPFPRELLGFSSKDKQAIFIYTRRNLEIYFLSLSFLSSISINI